ncbi:MAG: Asp-tRNA(Asn)/Glu-tRNA(Gln) amidotransferase subunit GatA, partial [Bacilli bacterium]|nr:Asp-tRNA(Asn)/Glu-tRNA(Gln) amidotransferase subunit GatA [Bacilli bacterium]
MDYLDLTISEIHQALVEKKTTPLALVHEALERAKQNKDNAFELLVEEAAIKEAKALGEPEEDNPLWGIPFVLKDNFSTKGIETTASSNILQGYIPLFDATIYAKLKQKKAILIGKTTLDELAMGGTGTTGHKGITYNPWDPKHERLVGGSSCGSATCVSAGIVPFSIGSDTGDSVRKPASYTGLVGFKPTWGRISRYGLFPFAPSLDHVAYFTRDVKDAA